MSNCLLSSLPSLLLLLVATSLAAQRLHEVVVVEQRDDIAARDRAGALLTETKLPLRGSLAIDQVCRLLQSACADKLNFRFMSKTKKVPDVAPLEVDLEQTTPLQVLALVQTQLELQPTWRAGLIALVPKDEVKPATWLEIYDVRAETMAVSDFPGPELTLRAPGDEPRTSATEEESKTTVSGFNADQLVELVRAHAPGGTWDGDGVSLSAQGGILLVRQTESGHRQVREVLAGLGVAAALPAAKQAKPAAAQQPTLPQSRRDAAGK